MWDGVGLLNVRASTAKHVSVGSNNATNGPDSILESACETQGPAHTWLGRKWVRTWRLSLAGLLVTSKWDPGTRRCTGQKQSYGVLKMYIFLSELWHGNLWNQCSAKESAVLSSATKMVYAYIG